MNNDQPTPAPERDEEQKAREDDRGVVPLKLSATKPRTFKPLSDADLKGD